MNRQNVGLFIDVLWLAFWAYWLISAARSKRTVRRNGFSIVMRLCIFLVVVIAVVASGNSSQFINASFSANPAVLTLGALLTFLGIGIAVWARVHLGRNWGMPMSLKENPELVTTGPYRYVRHPIYSGIILALLGSALIGGPFWLLVVVLFGIYFIYSAKQEEKLMSKEFPDQYPAYMKRSKMLIPWVF